MSDPGGIIASPLTVIDRRRESLLDRLRALCEEYEIETIVIGLPTSLSGVEGPAAERARDLGDTIAGAVGVPVQFWDERFTSARAEAILLEGGARRRKRREVKDKIAAAVMLQSYLDLRAHGAAD